MKTLLFGNCFMLIALLTLNSQQINSNDPSFTGNYPSGCTVVTIAKGDSVFFAGNDDYINPDSYYWVEPGDSSKYGVIWVGTPDNPQQGVNEKGLAYDANGLPGVDVNPHPERIPVPGEYHTYIMKIMHECETVKEVIDWVNTHQRHSFMHDQLHFADAGGDAVIISAGPDGEMVFTRKETGDGFLVSTNFNVANPNNGFSYPCQRYDRAHELLAQLIDKEEVVSHLEVMNVMDAVHVEGISWTIETMVADVVNGKVYLYYFYQYDRPVVLDVTYELTNPREPGPLSELFPEDVQKEATKRYNKLQERVKMYKLVGLPWATAVLISLILLFVIPSDPKKGLGFWISVILILGPVALTVRLIPMKKRNTTSGLIALTESLGNLAPVVIAYIIALVTLTLSMFSGNATPQLQVLMMFILPVILSLVFHSVFLARVGNNNIFSYSLIRLPQVLISTFLALGGIIALALPLVNNNLSMSLLRPLSPLAILTWWAFVAAGALAGGIFNYIFEYWSVKRGYRSWSVLQSGEAELNTPSLKRVWWWLLISIAVLFAGLLTGIVLISN